MAGLLYVFSSSLNDLNSDQKVVEIVDNQNLLVESNRSADFDDFEIERFNKEQVIHNIFELEALTIGVKPIIVDSKALELYNECKKILRSYVSSDMNDYEKVIAIYNWIGYNVTYDYDVLNKESNMLGAYNSFTSYGAIINKIAVCDGFASAFKLLCLIEGIECVESTGCVSNTGHAWNKVKINGEWLGVDTTWARSGKYITYKYLFINESDLMKTNHIENSWLPSQTIEQIATTHFNYYSYIITSLNCDLNIEDTNEFVKALEYMKNNDLKVLEIKYLMNSNFVFSLNQAINKSKISGVTYYKNDDTYFLIIK